MPRFAAIFVILAFFTALAAPVSAQSTAADADRQRLRDRVESLENDVQNLLDAVLMLRARAHVVDGELRIPLPPAKPGTTRAMDPNAMMSLIETEWLISQFFGHDGIGSPPPDFQNCTARCRRKNCMGLTGQDWIDCAVACDHSCRKPN